MKFSKLGCLAVLTYMSMCAGFSLAQERPTKVRPNTTQSYDESKKEFKEGDKVQVKRTKTLTVYVQENGVPVPRTNKVVEVVEVIVPKRTWMIGAQGWHDEEGYNIDNLVQFNVGGRLTPSPLSKIKTMINGRAVEVSLEPSDVITRIDGVEVKTEIDLFMAVHTASNPRNLTLEFINHRDGKTMTGTISPIKMRP